MKSRSSPRVRTLPMTVLCRLTPGGVLRDGAVSHRPRRLSRSWMLLLGLLCLVLVASSVGVADAYSPLSDEALRRLPTAEDGFGIEDGALLAPILVPRVSGTAGSQAVQNHFARFFRENLPAWQLQWHNTTSRTPVSGEREVPFVNLIARRDPPWTAVGDVARLTLVAHYDTLYRPEGFLGAIDSAAPCAMLLHVARAIDAALTAKWTAMEAAGEAGNGLEEERGVQILLLDGEEAFLKWSATDSLYGARALARDWEITAYEALSTFPTPLSAISLFVLLDLLGTADPRVPSYFQTTHWAYQHLATLEGRLRDLQLLESRPAARFLPDSGKDASMFARGFVEDDHVPFMNRGVEVLHVIPSPFPRVWHTMNDDGAHLDLPTVRDWAQIVAAFAAEWMELDTFFPAVTERERNEPRRVRTEL